MLPYKYKIGNIEARNYVLENYEIRQFGYMELVKHSKDLEFQIGTWKVSNDAVILEFTARIPDMSEKDRRAMDEVCSTTKKRLENEYLGSAL